MSLSRTTLLLTALSMALAPFAFGASKEIQELQRDVALLQDQVRTLQRAQDEKFAAMQALVQQTLESVNRTEHSCGRDGEQVQRRHEAAGAARCRAGGQRRPEAGSDG